MPLPSVIAVDGPAGSGKSTVSYLLAERLGYVFIDTGVFYRALTLVALRAGIAFDNTSALADLPHRTMIDIHPEPDDDTRQYSVWIDNREVTDELRAPAVEANVSTLSAVPEVRHGLLDLQRRIAAKGKIIMAGRDIGTVVLPYADVKFYVDASLEERARRRYHQYHQQGKHVELAEIEAALRQRDAVDTNRAISPLRRAEDAIYILTDDKTVDDVVDALVRHLELWKTA
ncbi:MAG: (d)CMP kinase [Chloroflexi bacterium]|nr:(d)CMP kinase [Chloroflexota bacterium]